MLYSRGCPKNVGLPMFLWRQFNFMGMRVAIISSCPVRTDLLLSRIDDVDLGEVDRSPHSLFPTPIEIDTLSPGHDGILNDSWTILM